MSSSRRSTAVLAAALALIVATLLAGAAEAQMAPAGAPGPSAATEDCLTVLTKASDCLTFVEAGSKLTVPDKPCCGEIKQVINSRPECLCQMLAKNNSLGIEFDAKKALKLPSICKVQTPSVSLCSLIGVPVAVPAGAPAGSSESSPVIGVPVAVPAGVPAGSSESSPGASPPGSTTGRATTNGHLSGVASLVGAAVAVLPFVFAF